MLSKRKRVNSRGPKSLAPMPTLMRSRSESAKSGGLAGEPSCCCWGISLQKPRTSPVFRASTSEWPNASMAGSNLLTTFLTS